VSKLPDEYDPDFPYPLVIDGSDPMPDPSWDYAPIYYRAISIRREVEALLKSIEGAEHRSPGLDVKVWQHLRQIAAQSKAAREDLGL
jgi:hypothetical protein